MVLVHRMSGNILSSHPTPAETVKLSKQKSSQEGLADVIYECTK